MHSTQKAKPALYFVIFRDKSLTLRLNPHFPQTAISVIVGFGVLGDFVCVHPVRGCGVSLTKIRVWFGSWLPSVGLMRSP